MGFLVAERLPATYESEATLLVVLSAATGTRYRPWERRHGRYAGIAQTATILNGAGRDVGMTPCSVESKLDVTASDITRLITVRARDGEAVRAAEIANSVAGALTQYANGQGLATPAEGRLTIVERAVPSTKISPSKDLIVPLAAIAGLLGALGLAAFVDSVSTVVRSEEGALGSRARRSPGVRREPSRTFGVAGEDGWMNEDERSRSRSRDRRPHD